MLKQTIQHVEGISNGAWNHNAVKSGKLITGEIIESNTAAKVEIFGVRAGIDCPDRHHESEAIGLSNFTATPFLCKRNFSFSLALL